MGGLAGPAPSSVHNFPADGIDWSRFPSDAPWPWEGRPDVWGFMTESDWTYYYLTASGCVPPGEPNALLPHGFGHQRLDNGRVEWRVGNVSSFDRNLRCRRKLKFSLPIWLEKANICWIKSENKWWNWEIVNLAANIRGLVRVRAQVWGKGGGFACAWIWTGG